MTEPPVQSGEPSRDGKLRVDAVLLAAGRASRMGGPNKLLSLFGGVRLIRKVAGELARSPVASTVVVTGHQAGAVSAALADLEPRIVFNPHYASGLASSLRVGLAALPGGCDGALVCLGDMPGIDARHVARLVDAFWREGGRAVVRATGEGMPGNPVILPRALFAAAASLDGDRGAKRLIAESGLAIVDVEIGEAALLDVDTPQALVEAGGQPAG